MSILGKTWQLKRERKPQESLWSALLASRQIEDPGHFFTKPTINDLCDPFLFPDMQKAVDRIIIAINSKERIIIYGDYDVDGGSGAALLIHTLRHLKAEVSYRIPNRLTEGYGLHSHYIEEFAKQNVKLLITVDLGISNLNEVDLANQNNIDVIVTDHHTVPSVSPKAFAILHPQLAISYPFKHLSGSGVAFKLAQALLTATKNEDQIPTLTDLASLGTVADLVPLTGENRTIVKLGLDQMQSTKWDGLRAMTESLNKEISTHTIGYIIGPRLNASGRMADPLWAIQTLLATGEEARRKSQKLTELNLERRHRTLEITEEADQAVDLSQPIIIQESPNWSAGVIGLIAGRLQEKHQKPVIILEDKGDELVGSVRSLPGFNAVKALDHVKELLEHYGGHEFAAGFRISRKNFDTFKQKLTTLAAASNYQAILEIDTTLNPEEITLETFDRIASFAPFGRGNETPTFLLQNVKILSAKPVGQDARHLRLTIKAGQQIISGIGFNFGPHAQSILSATALAVHLEKNEWQDRTEPQLKLVDFS
ncbi:single-stranded-DNA-specific exonuclease RecJ [Patescibacteria group bacterium]|nr:single-stranded-DNA-specific exonuclease RecJ [Patescibacteria group bacterium]